MKAEGIWECTVLGASFGETDKGSPEVQINVQISDPLAPKDTQGQRCSYEDQVNARSALYVGRSARAVGWKGEDLRTLKSDCAAWIVATGGKSTVEIRHIEIKNGKKAGQIWDKPNSIGRGSRVLKEPSRDLLNDANEAMRAAMAADAGGGDDGYDDGSHPAAYGGGTASSGSPADDIPFITCDASAEPSPIARVLR
jgi:hypothetical protein